MKARLLTLIVLAVLVGQILSAQVAHAEPTCFGEAETNTGWNSENTPSWGSTPAYFGSTGHDVYVGTQIGDSIAGSRAADAAKDQWDSLCGASGDDTINGYGGGDKISGGYHIDILFGDAGDDWVQGDSGDDNIYGGIGNDRLYGGTGNDEIDGGSGNDYIQDSGGTGDVDLVCDGPGSDTLNIKDGDGKDIWYLYTDGVNDPYAMDSGDRIVVVSKCPGLTG